MSVSAFIGLGSNLDTPLEHVEQACQQMNELADTRLVQHSPWYRSQAVGPGDQPDYINGVAELTTELGALDLLKKLQQIENQHGRKRSLRWGARTLDLDLLWYDGQDIDLPTLQVPHPRISERNFVLFPFKDIAPTLLLDEKHRVSDLADRLINKGIWRLDSETIAQQ